MTCIVGIAHKGKIWMGGDSASVCGERIQREALPKVYRRGEYLIGGAGDARIGDLLHYAFKPPTLPKHNLDRFMATRFIPALQKCFEKFSYPPADTENGDAFEGNILIGARGHLYNVDGLFAVGRVAEGFDAIGTGADLALGALYASANLRPQERLEVALSAAANFCQSVRPPFVIETL